jgi:hypothetical protein
VCRAVIHAQPAERGQGSGNNNDLCYALSSTASRNKHLEAARYTSARAEFAATRWLRAAARFGPAIDSGLVVHVVIVRWPHVRWRSNQIGLPGGAARQIFGIIMLQLHWAAADVGFSAIY